MLKAQTVSPFPTNMSSSRTQLLLVDASGVVRLLDCEPGLDPLVVSSGRPVRGFASWQGKRNFDGFWWSSTTRSSLGFESLLEQNALMAFDFDDTVSGVAVQPFALLWPWSGRSGPRYHVPDMFLSLADGTFRVVDVRPAERVDSRAAEQFERTRAAVCDLGWSYEVFGGIVGPRLSNLRFLAGFRQDRHEACSEQLRDAFVLRCPLRAGVQCAAALADCSYQCVLAGAYHLLWRHRLSADLDRLLGMDTLVWS